MSSNRKILDILLEEMGAEAILSVCQERIAATKKTVAAAPAETPAAKPVVAPGAPIKLASGKIVVKKVIKVAPKNLAADLQAAAPAPAPAAEPEKPVAAEPKKAGRPKKVAAEAPRCDGRVLGDQMEMEGTKAPNGKPLHCYLPAQCERKGLETLAVPEEGEPRHLKDGEEPTEEEGTHHLCKVCVKRWEARSEHPDNWHGFFDDNGAPETSHFKDGAWYKKKMAAAKAKAESAAQSAAQSDAEVDE